MDVLLFKSEGPASCPPGGDPLKSKLHDLEKFHLLEEETYTKRSRTKRRPTRYNIVYSCVYCTIYCVCVYCILLDTVCVYCLY